MQRNYTLIKNNKLLLILGAAFMRMAFYGFRYYPQLDDYIQYGVYSFTDKWHKLISLGLYSTRPLANLADLYVWSNFWRNMWIVFIIITLLHAISAYLFVRTSEILDFPLGMAFVAIYLLCPINMESTYWVSASTRIIIGTFLCSLSCWYLVKDKENHYLIFNLLSLFFYEQVTILSVILSILIIYKKKSWRVLPYLIINIFVFLLYYILFAKVGASGNRAILKIINFEAIADIIKSWSFWSLFTTGFVRGLTIAGSFILVALLAGVLMSKAEQNHQFKMSKVIVGAIVFISAYIPIIILENYSMAFRINFIPLIGLAMMIDAIFDLTKKWKKYITLIMAFVFIVISYSELHDYRENYRVDTKIIQHVAENLDTNKVNVLQGQKDCYIRTNASYKEHILSVTSRDWAITGAVRLYLKDESIPYIQNSAQNVENANIIYLNDFSFMP